ncbi:MULTISPECIES: cupin [Dietzia]|uniref:cupin n=1 Tax=Dietzia TaxID=37914 RepID=UPI0015C9F552|nr:MULTISPECIES: cupin [Dietzia]MBB1033285.1 cupin [Dietzia sp. CQ4]MCT1516987.1 cupin [Dietzia cercidiphylli]
MTTVNDTADRILARAADAPHGRHAEIIVHEGPLRQSLLALTAGTELEEHNSPPAASLYLLRGAVRVTGETTVDIGAGELHALTHHRHAVTALEDSVFLLTTVTGIEGTGSHADPPSA